jgi:hypothetical protein
MMQCFGEGELGFPYFLCALCAKCDGFAGHQGMRIKTDKRALRVALKMMGRVVHVCFSRRMQAGSPRPDGGTLVGK